MIRHSNAYAALVMLGIVATVLISYFVVVPIFAKLYDYFDDDSDYELKYPNETACTGHGYWYESSCHQLPVRGKETFRLIRSRWLLAPVIFIISMVVWYLTTVFRRDPQQYLR